LVKWFFGRVPHSNPAFFWFVSLSFLFVGSLRFLLNRFSLKGDRLSTVIAIRFANKLLQSKVHYSGKTAWQSEFSSRIFIDKNRN